MQKTRVINYIIVFEDTFLVNTFFRHYFQSTFENLYERIFTHLNSLVNCFGAYHVCRPQVTLVEIEYFLLIKLGKTLSSLIENMGHTVSIRLRFKVPQLCALYLHRVV